MKLGFTAVWGISILALSMGDVYAQDRVEVKIEGKTETQTQTLRDDTTLRTAKEMIKSDKPAAAYALLLPLEATLQGEVYFNYLLGIAALNSGQLAHAQQALERVLAYLPDFTGARLDLARACFQLADKSRAKSEFETVLKQNPTDATRATALKYLTLLASHKQTSSTPRKKHPARTLDVKVKPIKRQPPHRIVTENQGVEPFKKVVRVKVESNQNSQLSSIKISKFRVEGNHLLAANLLKQILSPYTGDNKSLADIQHAIKSLTRAYRNAGFSAVNVNTPEQEIKNGIVVIGVSESVVGNVIISGNKHHDTRNVRAALPALREGFSPNVRELSENIRLANQNASRQMSVVLTKNKIAHKVDAKITVQDDSYHKVVLTLNNLGSATTGMYRTGISYQNNNLFNHDQSATLGYITSPNHVKQVTQVTGSYRVPLYTLGSSVDLIVAYTDTDNGIANTVAGPLSFRGQGSVLGIYYNHYLPRLGNYISKFTVGIDYRAYVNHCSLGIFGAAGCGPSAASVTVHPVSVGYEGTLSQSSTILDYGITLVHNIPGGNLGGASAFKAVRPSPVSGNGAKADYNLLRIKGSLTGALPKQWQYRLTAKAQYTPSALIYAEHIGLVGANAVRGFHQRELASDKGYVVNLELYTPELASTFGLDNRSLKLLGFIDHAQGWKVPLRGESAMNLSATSAGVGLRLMYGKHFMSKFDLARIIDAGGTKNQGKVRLQLGVVIDL
ncbi:MAG: ShlB/FhaC/HecB family hemolysin secretion/activation protein [Gallionella sp.]